MNIYLPRQIDLITPTHESPLFFLVGPVHGGGDWQSRMVDCIGAQAPNAHIACPTPWGVTHRLARYFVRSFCQASNRQLVWERHYIRQAIREKNVPGCVIVWLPCESISSPRSGPEPYARDTRREVGKFTAYAELGLKPRVVFGGETEFLGLSVILFELRAAMGETFKFYESMTDLVDRALQIARQ